MEIRIERGSGKEIAVLTVRGRWKLGEEKVQTEAVAEKSLAHGPGLSLITNLPLSLSCTASGGLTHSGLAPRLFVSKLKYEQVKL